MDHSKKVRLAVAGCGFAARMIHAPRLSLLKDKFEIIGVADPVESNAAQAADAFGCGSMFSNVETMISKTDPEALAIFTPIHAGLVQQGLERGLDLFVEKPFCETVEQAEQMTAVALQRGQVVQVGAMRAFDPAIDHIRSQLPVIGPVRWVEIHDYCGQSLSAGSGGSMIAGNFQSALQVPAGRPRNGVQTMLLEFIHDISILRSVFGTPFSCSFSSLAKDGWSATGVINLIDGIPCLFATTEYGLPKVNHFEVRLEIFGENGFIKADFGDANDLEGGITVVEQSEKDRKIFRHDVFLEEWKAFHQSIINRETLKNNASDGTADISLGYEIVEKGLV